MSIKLKYKENKIENYRKRHKELMRLMKIYISCAIRVPVTRKEAI